jgi:hypothetical protein
MIPIDRISEFRVLFEVSLAFERELDVSYLSIVSDEVYKPFLLQCSEGVLVDESYIMPQGYKI